MRSYGALLLLHGKGDEQNRVMAPVCLGTMRLKESHTGENVASWVRQHLDSYKVNFSQASPLIISACTIDKGSNLSPAAANLGLFWQICYAHNAFNALLYASLRAPLSFSLSLVFRG